jgi:hypothetical protein
MHDVVSKRSRVAKMTRARSTIWTGKHREKLPECTGVFHSGPALLMSSSSSIRTGLVMAVLRVHRRAYGLAWMTEHVTKPINDMDLCYGHALFSIFPPLQLFQHWYSAPPCSSSTTNTPHHTLRLSTRPCEDRICHLTPTSTCVTTMGYTIPEHR